MDAVPRHILRGHSPESPVTFPAEFVTFDRGPGRGGRRRHSLESICNTCNSAGCRRGCRGLGEVCGVARCEAVARHWA